VASDSSGRFVVAWMSDDGDYWGVFAQRYASTSVPLGGEFRVNTYTTKHQVYPSVASDSAGNFVVAWMSRNQDGSYWGVFAQRYAGTGSPLGGEFRVNTYTTSYQDRPSVASDSTGNFVVTWESFSQDGSYWGVFAQRYASTGAPLGTEFRINTYTSGLQTKPIVASDSAGNFVVAWEGYPQEAGTLGVFGQRYSGAGAPLGGEFRVNTYTTGNQFLPFAASDPSGNFLVAWTSDMQDGSGYGVFAQRYSMIVPVELQSFRVE
jgi:hypothetical protein